MTQSRYYVSALLPSGTPRWNAASSVGTPVNVTFSFMTEAPSYASWSDSYGFVPMSETQKSAARAALATWADVANITFTEVSDANFGGSIRFGTNYQSYYSAAYSYYPTTSDGTGGDIYISKYDSDNYYPSPGNEGFHTLVHEIGHAIGLKHPGNYNSSGGGTEGPYLPTAEDNQRYTAMSYYRQSTSDYNTYSSAPALYDVAAVQYLYGSNISVRSGDDTYVFSNTTSPFTKVIWDGGGNDTIDASTQTRSIEIELSSGAFSSIGISSYSYYYAYSAIDNISIAFDTNIENAVGGSGADTLIGNSLNNSLSGGSGGDTLKGENGDDTLKGAAGADWLYGGNGNDFLSGDADSDYLYGNDGNDILNGGAAQDDIYGGAGSDIIYGGDAADTLRGETGEDIIYGGAGADYLYGADGNDTLDGGAGGDVLSGGAGTDTAVWHLPRTSYTKAGKT